MTIKLSILAFYQRIFAIPRFLLITRTVGTVVIAWWLALSMVAIFSCRPVHGFWDRKIEPKCINTEAFFIGNALPNILTDIVILCLPIRMVWQLQTSLGEKVALTATFLLGGVWVYPRIDCFEIRPRMTSLFTQCLRCEYHSSRSTISSQ